MGEHESQGKRVRARGRQQSGNPSLLSGTDPEANPDLAVGGGTGTCPKRQAFELGQAGLPRDRGSPSLGRA